MAARAMASRSPLRTDPQMHMEEELTLLRISSSQKWQRKPEAYSQNASKQKLGILTGPENINAPQRRRFVFTDPIAFR